MEPAPVLTSAKADLEPNSAAPNPRSFAASACSIPCCCWSAASSVRQSFSPPKTSPTPLPQPVLFLLVWVLGALISLCACFAFAELGSMFPDSGGQYIYLREAYGDLVAFLYGWMLFAVANGGTIAALSVAAAAYVGQIVPFVSQDHVMFTILGVAFTRAHLFGLVLIAILTFVNVVGLRWGALLQNVSTWTKFTAMAAFVVLGFAIGKGNWSNFHANGVSLTWDSVRRP